MMEGKRASERSKHGQVNEDTKQGSWLEWGEWGGGWGQRYGNLHRPYTLQLQTAFEINSATNNKCDETKLNNFKSKATLRGMTPE